MGRIQFRKPPLPGLPPAWAALVAAVRASIEASRFDSLDQLGAALYGRPASSERRDGRRISEWARGAEFPQRDDLATLVKLCDPSGWGRVGQLYAAAAAERTAIPPSLAAVLAFPRDPNDVRGQVRRPRTDVKNWAPPGTPISDVIDPLVLEVHEAITVAGAGALPVLPPYLERNHDVELRARLTAAVGDGRSTMVVLVGGSSTGKTRACWEALHVELDEERLLAGWRLWHPFDPTRPEAALADLEWVGPRTVVWLNEAQFYLLTEGSDLGERVGARLRTLLTDPGRAPVLILGTMWTEFWDTLTRPPGPKTTSVGPRDPHAQARQLLVGTHISVAESFDQAVLDKQRTSADDPRLVEAATRAKDGELTQYLAGAPALLQRYETAPAAPRALLNAAMDLRRLGHGPALPLALLRAVTPGYLTERQWSMVRRDDNWFAAAVAYTEVPCHGAQSPLSRVWLRSPHPDTSPSRYRLADYLEQIGRKRRHREIVPATLWSELAAHVEEPRDARQLGRAAAARLLYCHAIPLLRLAADMGDKGAQVMADMLASQGDLNALRRRAFLAGPIPDQSGLAHLTGLHDLAPSLRREFLRDEDVAELLVELLAVHGDLESLRQLTSYDARIAFLELLTLQGDLEKLQQLADTGDGMAHNHLVEVLADRGEHRQLQQLARDNRYASQLAWVLTGRDDLEQLRQRADTGDQMAVIVLARRLFALGHADELARRVDNGDHAVSDWLAALLAYRGDLDELRRRADAGDQHAGRWLGELLAVRDLDELRRRADTSDSHAAQKLGTLLAFRGDLHTLRRCADNGNNGAAELLAQLLVARGNLDDLRRRADSDQHARRMVELITNQDDIDEIRQRAGRGSKTAADRLAEYLYARGDLEELRRRDGKGDEAAAEGLALLLLGRGDVAELRRRADAGNAFAAQSLASLLVSRGDFDELRRRTEMRDRHAADALTNVLLLQGKIDELQQRPGDQFAVYTLGWSLAARGRLDELQQLADTAEIFHNYADVLATILAIQGDLGELRWRASAGERLSRESAMGKLVWLLAVRGDLDELRRIADTTGGTISDHAAEKLVKLMSSRGDIEELHTEVLRGNRAAASRLVHELIQQRTHSAENLRRFGLDPDGAIPGHRYE